MNRSAVEAINILSQKVNMIFSSRADLFNLQDPGVEGCMMGSSVGCPQLSFGNCNNSWWPPAPAPFDWNVGIGGGDRGKFSPPLLRQRIAMQDVQRPMCGSVQIRRGILV